MPWCATCDRFYNPNSLEADGTCPTCGHTVVELAGVTTATQPEKTPWHFKVLVAAVVLYLAWRIVQMIGWLV